MPLQVGPPRLAALQAVAHAECTAAGSSTDTGSQRISESIRDARDAPPATAYSRLADVSIAVATLPALWAQRVIPTESAVARGATSNSAVDAGVTGVSTAAPDVHVDAPLPQPPQQRAEPCNPAQPSCSESRARAAEVWRGGLMTTVMLVYTALALMQVCAALLQTHQLWATAVSRALGTALLAAAVLCKATAGALYFTRRACGSPPTCRQLKQVPVPPNARATAPFACAAPSLPPDTPDLLAACTRTWYHPWLVVPFLRSCRSLTQIWLGNGIHD